MRKTIGFVIGLIAPLALLAQQQRAEVGGKAGQGCRQVAVERGREGAQQITEGTARVHGRNREAEAECRRDGLVQLYRGTNGPDRVYGHLLRRWPLWRKSRCTRVQIA